MGETLLGEHYGLTADERMKAEQMLAHIRGGKKTPYMLDLEVMDRKPVLVPKVGDRVRIKSREWYEKWKVCTGSVPVPCGFIEDMSHYCGKTMEIKSQKEENRFRLKDADYTWCAEMFEEVYPVQAQVDSLFPRITLDDPGQLSAHCTETGMDILKKYPAVAVKIEEAGKRLAAYTVAKGLSAKPKLKQVKTTRLMKITKL